MFPFNCIGDDNDFLCCLFNFSNIDNVNVNFIKNAAHLNIIGNARIVNGDIDPDKNYYSGLYKAVDYYIPDKFNKFITKNNLSSDNFSILYLNAQSLGNKLDYLLVILAGVYGTG